MDDQLTGQPEPEPGPAPEPAGPRPSILARIVDDEITMKRAALAFLFAFIVLIAAGGFSWHHLPLVLGFWCGAGACLLAAWALGWEPNEAPPAPPTEITYYEAGGPVPQPMRAPGPPPIAPMGGGGGGFGRRVG